MWELYNEGGVSRQELTAGMAGQFSAQESTLVFDLADSNGDGEQPEEESTQTFPTNLLDCLQARSTWESLSL